jgi:hypothetical protein
MAFDFLGTFTKSQFDRFEVFVRDQATLIDGRIAHLQAERDRIGNLAFAFDSGGVPTDMTSDPPSTYVGKLFSVYEALGGDAFYDLQVRSTSQPVFKLKGDETKQPQQMSNGEITGTPGLSDAASSELLRQARDWTQETLTYRRDALERKVRRAVDYAEQLKIEIARLQTVKSAATVSGALDFVINGIRQLLGDRNYLAASNDGSKPDPHGKLAYAPFAAYMPGGAGKGADSDDFQRTNDGPAVPGNAGST